MSEVRVLTTFYLAKNDHRWQRQRCCRMRALTIAKMGTKRWSLTETSSWRGPATCSLHHYFSFSVGWCITGVHNDSRSVRDFEIAEVWRQGVFVPSELDVSGGCRAFQSTQARHRNFSALLQSNVNPRSRFLINAKYWFSRSWIFRSLLSVSFHLTFSIWRLNNLKMIFINKWE